MNALREGLAAQALGLPLLVDVDHRRLLVMSWETGRLYRLLAAHPERQIELPEWAVPDFDVISGRKEPLPITPPDGGDVHGRGDDDAGHHHHPGPRLEHALRALTAAGCSPIAGTEGRWRALCPLCRLRGRYDRRVLVTYQPATASARLHCFSTAHNGAELRAALGLPAGRLVTLAGQPVERPA